MAKRDQTSFGGPHVDARVTDPAALAYAKSMQERMGTSKSALGGQTPPIPRLDMPFQEGMTMADQARAAAMPQPGSVDPETSIFPTAPIISTEPARTAPNLSRPPPNLLPQDVLPEAARQDPAFRDGQGAMYAAAQPHLAYKYGVIRNKQFISPQQLAGGGRPGGLSEKTVEGLKAVQEFQQKREVVESGESRVEAEAAAGPAGVVAEAAGGAQQLSDEDRQKVRRAIDQMDNFDWNTFKQMTMKDILNNDEQRKIIEGRLGPLPLDSLIVDGYIRQIVPIIPDKFEPIFQSISGDEELACKRLVVSEAKSLDVSEQYLVDKHSFMVLCCGLHAINKTPFPSHRDKTGQFDDKLFWEKFTRIIRMPFHMLASLSINFFWFDVRVRKLFVAENLGNG